jgi:hypothetical protein
MDIKHGLTREQFIELLTHLAPGIVQSCLAAKLALPEMAKQVALFCFIYWPEWSADGQINILRRYIRNLNDVGVFGFDDE